MITKPTAMKKIKLLGIITIIFGLGIAYFTERTDYQFVCWIMTAFGAGWALTGSYTVSKRKNYTETSHIDH